MSPKTIRQLVVWFALGDDADAELAPSDAGILRGEVLPGLWLQPSAIWTNDMATLIEIV